MQDLEETAKKLSGSEHGAQTVQFITALQDRVGSFNTDQVTRIIVAYTTAVLSKQAQAAVTPPPTLAAPSPITPTSKPAAKKAL